MYRPGGGDKGTDTIAGDNSLADLGPSMIGRLIDAEFLCGDGVEDLIWGMFGFFFVFGEQGVLI